MSREVIQDFLNLAGVVGIALTNRRMRPYFYGLDSVLDRTKQALGQGVLQVVENLPEGFESFEFHFGSYIVFIYKLTHGLVLLVLTDKDLELVSYGRSVTKIKYLIETDTYNTVAYFKLLLGSMTQHSLPSTSWTGEQPNSKTVNTPTTHSFNEPRPKPDLGTNSTPSWGANRTSANNTQANNTQANNTQANNTLSRTNNAGNLNKTSDNLAATNTQSRQSPRVEPTVNPNLKANTSPNNNLSPSLPTPPVNPAIATANQTTSRATSPTPPTTTKPSAPPTPAQDYKLDELLDALNKLSHFTTQYLGKVVVTNYWKSTRPDASWLKEFEVDRNGQISHPQQSTLVCKSEQVQQMREWVATYVKRCKQVIRNFDQMLTEDCLNAHQKQILF